MNYLYINLPKLNNKKMDFSILKKGDSLCVRINELPESEIHEILIGLEKLKLKIDLSFEKTNDAYGSIQKFNFN